MANTFELIDDYVVGAGGIFFIEFAAIPATYTDLILKLSLRTTRNDTTDPVLLNINNETTGTNYQYRSIWTTGSTAVDAYSNGGTSNWEVQYATANNSTASLFNNYELYLTGYAQSGDKVAIGTGSHQQLGGASYLVTMGYSWNNTSAISSLKLTDGYGAVFAQYSTAYLYGIKKN